MKAVIAVGLVMALACGCETVDENITIVMPAPATNTVPELPTSEITGNATQDNSPGAVQVVIINNGGPLDINSPVAVQEQPPTGE